MTTAAPAAAPAPVFIPTYEAHLFDAFYGVMALPVPGADLWWDDASYARYQSADPEYVPAGISQGAAYSPDYCEGRPPALPCGGTEYRICGDPHCLDCIPF